jgi:hypothetical protein
MVFRENLQVYEFCHLLKSFDKYEFFDKYQFESKKITNKINFFLLPPFILYKV